MRQLLNDLATYLADLVGAARRGWGAFFFSPADPTAVGLIRVAVGLLAFWSLLVFGLDLHDYFGADGWAEPSAIRMTQGPMVWTFWYLVPDDWLRLVWCGCLLVLGLYAVGLFSRLTAVLSWVIVVSTVRRVPIALYGFDQVAFDSGALSGSDGGERPVDLARSVLATLATGSGLGRPDREAVGPNGPAGLARRACYSLTHGLGQPDLATDPASSGRDLRHCRPGQAPGPVVVERDGAVGDDDGRRVRGPGFHRVGGLAVADQSADARQPDDRVTLSGVDVGSDRATALAGGCGGDAPGDRHHQPGT